MKAIRHGLRRLIAGTAIALSVATPSRAQLAPPPSNLTNPPPTPEQIAAALTALAAAQQADYQTNYAPWAIPDIPMPGGSQLTSDALQAQSQSDLLSLSTSIYNDFFVPAGGGQQLPFE